MVIIAEQVRYIGSHHGLPDKCLTAELYDQLAEFLLLDLLIIWQSWPLLAAFDEI